MAIDQQTTAKARVGLFDELEERFVIGLIKGFDASFDRGEAKLSGVDLVPPPTTRAIVPRPMRTWESPH